MSQGSRIHNKDLQKTRAFKDLALLGLLTLLNLGLMTFLVLLGRPGAPGKCIKGLLLGGCHGAPLFNAFLISRLGLLKVIMFVWCVLGHGTFFCN